MARSVSECIDFPNTFNENSKINDSSLKKKNRTSHFVQSRQSTVDIVINSSTVLECLQSDTHVDFKILLNAIILCLDIDLLYDTSDINGHQSHGMLSNIPL